jgi:hypothetical protein
VVATCSSAVAVRWARRDPRRFAAPRPRENVGGTRSQSLDAGRIRSETRSRARMVARSCCRQRLNADVAPAIRRQRGTT